MFSFLKKRVSIVDAMEGYIDIHNHILPGIDDGASNVDDSISLVKKMTKFGINGFIATPHIMNDYYPNTPETIGEALQKLQQTLKDEGLEKVQIKAAAEYMMDQSFLNLIENEELLTLYESYVLVEMSYLQAPINLNNILFQLQTKRYKPVLAHPERYAYFHSRTLEKYEEVKARGCLFQLNILSLTGHYGKNIQKTAFKLLEENLIDFIGTDTHQMRHLEKLSEATIPEKEFDSLRELLKRTTETFKPSFY